MICCNAQGYRRVREERHGLAATDDSKTTSDGLTFGAQLLAIRSCWLSDGLNVKPILR